MVVASLARFSVVCCSRTKRVERERETKTKTQTETDRDRRRAKGRTEKCVCRCFHSRFLSLVLDSSSNLERCRGWRRSLPRTTCLSGYVRVASWRLLSSPRALSSLSLPLSLPRRWRNSVLSLLFITISLCARDYCLGFFFFFLFCFFFFFRFCSQKNHLLLLLLLRLILGPMKMDCLVLLSGLQTENSGGNRAFLLRRHRHSTKMRFYCCLFPDELLAGDRSLSWGDFWGKRSSLALEILRRWRWFSLSFLLSWLQTENSGGNRVLLLRHLHSTQTSFFQ